MVKCTDGMSEIAASIIRKLCEITKLKNQLAMLVVTEPFEERSLSKQFREFMDNKEVEPRVFKQGISDCQTLRARFGFSENRIIDCGPKTELREKRLQQICSQSGYFFYRGILFRNIESMVQHYGKEWSLDQELNIMETATYKYKIGNYFPTLVLQTKRPKIHISNGNVVQIKGKNIYYEVKPGLREGIEPNPGPGRRRNNKNKKIKRRRIRKIDPFWIALFNSPKIPAAYMPGTSTRQVEHKTFSFTQTGVLSNGSNSFLIVEFKPNDMYDPEAAVTGGQPAAFNAWMAIYNYFVVRRFKIELTVNNIEVDFSANCYITFKDAQPSSTITTYQAAKDSSRIGPVSPLLTIPPTNAVQKKLITPWFDVRAIVGNGLAVTGLGFVGAANASPAQVIWASLVVYSPDASTFFGVGIDYTINVKYDASLFSTRTNIA